MAGALDESISILKSDLKDAEKRMELESLVDQVPDLDFNSLLTLSQSLTDYVAPGMH